MRTAGVTAAQLRRSAELAKCQGGQYPTFLVFAAAHRALDLPMFDFAKFML